MTDNANLKTALVALRATIRGEEASNGTMPFVCSDFAIDEMVRIRPSNLDDICSIPSVSEEFRHRYAPRFLQCINGGAPANASAADSGETLRILHDLSKKLSNLKDSNQMLMLKGESATEHMDLSRFGLNFEDIVGGEAVKLCGTSQKDSAMRERIDNLLGEIRNSQRDRGHNLLYLAYPFVEGRIELTDVRLRAPLALFPMSIEKVSGRFMLRLDRSRDIVINNILMLAILDSRGDLFEAEDPVLDIEPGISLGDLLRGKYADYCRLEGEVGAGDVPFKTISTQDYNPEPGYRIVNHCVLGKFSNDSGTLQRDYSMIREIGVPPTVTTLLGKNLEDIYFEYREDGSGNRAGVPEKGLHYISRLNDSQEQILRALDNEDAIVVQGPPGTGKSEAITAAIIDLVNRGRNVLVVSEKNTALEVIKNRLGNLGKYAIMINQASDKEVFYRQISEFWNTKATDPAGGIDSRSSEIDSLVPQLARIAEEVYRPIPGFGISAVELYARGRTYDFDRAEDRERFSRVRGHITPSLMGVDYPTLDAMSRDLSNHELVERMFAFLSRSTGSSVLTMLRDGLYDSDIILFIQEVEAIRGMKKGGFLSRNKDRTRAVRNLLDRYLVPGTTADQVEEIVQGDLGSLVGEYRTKNTSHNVFENYGEVQKEYVRTLFALTGGDVGQVDAVNRELLECILFLHLEEFDHNHSGTMANIASFNAIIERIDRIMGEKAALERVAVEHRFTTSIQAISGSRMRADIQNVLYNSATKYPISRFMQRFGPVLLDNVKVWLMTPDAVSDILPITREPQFDILIFDEASQMYVERGIPSICRARKVVVAGDHKQLRPTALPGSGRVRFTEDLTDYDSEVDLALEQESLLDLARLCFQSYTLNCHYRSRYEELIQFSNSAFYHNRLIMAPNPQIPSEAPIEYIQVDGLWHEQYNAKEARAVAELISRIVKTEGHGTIGVIAFNIKQARSIASNLSRMRSEDGELDRALTEEECRVDSNGADVKMFIENIDHVQGDERDIIIFSTTYAKDINNAFYQRFGWLNNHGGENRLNVAVTRAKSKVYVVTSMLPSDISSLNNGPRLLSKYLEYSKAVSDHYAGKVGREAIIAVLRSIGDDGERIPESRSRGCEMLDALQEALLNRGYSVDRDVGVGSNTIDLAVRDHRGYIIGICADTSVYGSDANVRERDIHNPRYLSLRGWRVVRMWTPLYWASKAQEIERICRLVDEAVRA